MKTNMLLTGAMWGKHCVAGGRGDMRAGARSYEVGGGEGDQFTMVA
jgi:hypothetical protein